DDDGKVLKSFHTRRGRITGIEYGGPESMEPLAIRYRARQCLVLREGVVEEIGERVARRIERGDDYISQLLVIARTVRELNEAQLLLTWPRPLADVPIP